VLARAKSKQALKILRELLADDKFASLVIDNLSQVKSVEAVSLLGSALNRESTAPQAELSLERIAKSRAHPSARQAASILNKWRTKRRNVKPGSRLPPPPPDPIQIHNKLTPSEWDILTRLIWDGKCTPVIGPAIAPEQLPSFPSLARRLADDFVYPLPDHADLSSVVEYGSQRLRRETVEDHIKQVYEQTLTAKTLAVDNTFAVLASLPLPIYITTTFDDSLVRALRAQNKSPQEEICRWNDDLRDAPPAPDDSLRPTVTNPLVVYLYGRLGVNRSLVLTDDDYLKLLINVIKNPSIVSGRVRKALGDSTNLFLGFDFLEWSGRFFLNLRKCLVGTDQSRTHFATVIPPKLAEQYRLDSAVQFLKQYFSPMTIHPYWGSAAEFSVDVRQRWDKENFRAGTTRDLRR
jgi:hypothetical protein